MSGPAHSPRPMLLLSIKALAVLTEARGEVDQAEVQMATLLPDQSDTLRGELLSVIKANLSEAFRANDLAGLEDNIQQAEDNIRRCLRVMEQASYPPLAVWRQRHQLAMDWLSCSLGRLKVVLTYVRLDQVMQAN